MLMESQDVIRERQKAARKWRLEAWPIDPETEQGRALALLCLTPTISDYLAEHDPQGLKQAQKALNGKSWEDYV